MISPEDLGFMARALRLAERGQYSTHPNPRVGCVLTLGGRIVGEGFHIRAGDSHAEAMALKVAGKDAAGATAYVTLEPCSFKGRTPSCAESLIAAGITRVVAATTDPHPRNRGEGFRILREAGIVVDTPVLETSARQLNPGHVLRYENNRPFVRLKLAMSLDGKTALKNGASQWITGAMARQDVQRLRARSSAIVTGVQTVIDDNPALTVRELDHPYGEIAKAVTRPLFVLDSHGRIPPEASVLERSETRIVSVSTNEALAQAQLILPAEKEGRVSLPHLMTCLVEHDCHEVLFECGATLAGAALAARLVDELVVYTGPVLMGHSARSLLNLPELDKMSDLLRLRTTDVRHVGEDLRLTMQPIYND